jgi:hypothetical protein
MLAPLLAMQVIWYVTWVPGLEQGLVTGMAVAVAAAIAGRAAASRSRTWLPGTPEPHRTDPVRGAAGTEAPDPQTAPRVRLPQ